MTQVGRAEKLQQCVRQNQVLHHTVTGPSAHARVTGPLATQAADGRQTASVKQAARDGQRGKWPVSRQTGCRQGAPDRQAAGGRRRAARPREAIIKGASRGLSGGRGEQLLSSKQQTVGQARYGVLRQHACGAKFKFTDSGWRVEGGRQTTACCQRETLREFTGRVAGGKRQQRTTGPPVAGGNVPRYASATAYVERWRLCASNLMMNLGMVDQMRWALPPRGDILENTDHAAEPAPLTPQAQMLEAIPALTETHVTHIIMEVDGEPIHHQERLTSN
ncbi:hypothetical protein GGX14DRAFT_392275 [Mycena pura]|uniref:Uncharacterized protein n=1 Tax=Mycena pura TaxID=153505 RepID=A0AAD6VLB9_9AGAR|nr:hypothetical protein GGX14DRAFT_392275 [Mycena pura]